ncbi:Aste57867_23771 [Aphanomyces stellatus]|uniref:Aste57867_23771 protein n=1 Tax=Aphanomyces stellatus TaxID=120398 RepID=A0A485LNN4_9STRA|nr:hypothetical protein As57867_023698 [Aphanomyces stellatus]VFU00416.1 Aste57867_23771 [Aphanomyces stellatus]
MMRPMTPFSAGAFVGGPHINPAALPRVSSSLSPAALKDECRARGLPNFASMTKAQLLESLVAGTILLTALPEFIYVEKVKSIMQDEASRQAEEASALHAAAAADWTPRRQQEVAAQIPLHIYSMPAVHACRVANTSVLRVHGQPRTERAQCRVSEFLCSRFPWVSCEKCNFDVCYDCGHYLQLAPAEQFRRRQEHAAEMAAAAASNSSKRDRGSGDVDDATAAVKRSRPFAQANQQDPKTLLPFVVWTCLDNSGQQQRQTTCHGTCLTVGEANARARHVFYTENPWGLVSGDLEASEETMTSDKLVHFETTRHETRWTVAVTRAQVDRQDDMQVLPSDDEEMECHPMSRPTAWPRAA